MSPSDILPVLTGVIGTVASIIQISAFLKERRLRRSQRSATPSEVSLSAPSGRQGKASVGGRGGMGVPSRTAVAVAPAMLGPLDRFLMRRSVPVRQVLTWTFSLLAFSVLLITANAATASGVPGADPRIGFNLTVNDLPMTHSAFMLAIYLNCLWSGLYVYLRIKGKNQELLEELTRLHWSAQAYRQHDPSFVDPNALEYEYAQERAKRFVHAAPIWIGFFLSVMSVGAVWVTRSLDGFYNPLQPWT